jgi:hypothetical protein
MIIQMSDAAVARAAQRQVFFKYPNFVLPIEVSQNHELHRLWGDQYNATNVSYVRSENARRHGEAIGRVGHARYQHTLAERHVTKYQQ